MMPASTNDATCLASQIGMNGRQETGLAIMDTGASRNVIGNDHVPAVLQKLPEAVRNMVREQPSRVGFSFGNNQIAYSFKLIQLPLNYGERRIWLLIEVVPHGMPFSLINQDREKSRSHTWFGKLFMFSEDAEQVVATQRKPEWTVHNQHVRPVPNITGTTWSCPSRLKPSVKCTTRP